MVRRGRSRVTWDETQLRPGEAAVIRLGVSCRDRLIVIDTTATEFKNHADRLADRIIDVTGEVGIDRQALLGALQKAKQKGPGRIVRLVARTGFIGANFVTPGWTSGPRGDARPRFNPALAGRPAVAAVGQRSGTVSEWRRTVGRWVGFSGPCMTVIGAALAAPILELAHMPESFVVVLVGDSSTGKSIGELAAISVQGRAERDAILSARFSEAGFEDAQAAFNALLMPIDDLMAVPEGRRRQIIEGLAYGATGGARRTIRRHSGQAPEERVATIVLASSEHSSAAIAMRAGAAQNLGEQARLINVVVAPASKGGIFDLGHCDGLSSEEMARALEADCRRYYGAPLHQFVRWITDQDQAGLGQRVGRLIADFKRRAADRAPSVQRRAAEKFGLIAAALCLAHKAGVTPWPRRVVFRVLTQVFQRSMGAFGATSTGPELLGRLVDLLNEDEAVLWIDRARPNPLAAGRWLLVTGVARDGRPAFGLRRRALVRAFPNPVELDLLCTELRTRRLLLSTDVNEVWKPRIRVDAERVIRPRLLEVAPGLIDYAAAETRLAD